MADELSVDGQSFISSRRAAQTTGYTQDYIGQLARASLIVARRVGGLWYVSPDSLNIYRTKAGEYKPQPPQQLASSLDLETSVSFDGKKFVSASRAAKITGYHQDYVGQLARSGKIESRQIGSRWFVDQDALTSHKKEKDDLLASVQTESVGVAAPERGAENRAYSEPFFTYSRESHDLLPLMSPIRSGGVYGPSNLKRGRQDPEDPVHSLPIRRINERGFGDHAYAILPSPRRGLLLLAAAALTIVIVLSIAGVTLKDKAIYALLGNSSSQNESEAASVGTSNVFDRFAEELETIFARELTYVRQN